MNEHILEGMRMRPLFKLVRGKDCPSVCYAAWGGCNHCPNAEPVVIDLETTEATVIWEDEPIHPDSKKVEDKWDFTKDLDDFQEIAYNLFKEGQTSRAEAVTYLINRCKRAEFKPIQPTSPKPEKRYMAFRFEPMTLNEAKEHAQEMTVKENHPYHVVKIIGTCEPSSMWHITEKSEWESVDRRGE